MTTVPEPVAAMNELKHRYSQFVEGELRVIRAALSDIGQIVDKLPEELARPYTIPAAFRRSYDENFISDYLAFLLDPNKNGIGNSPLKSLLAAADFDATNLALQHVSIKREFTFPGGGRIDLLIEADDAIVGIENKIFSLEGKNQTVSYSRSIKKLFPEHELFLIFLAPGVHKPSSLLFRHLSYARLLEEFKTTKLDIGENRRSSFFWEDFILHLEVYIAMAHKLPEISERTELYIENINIIQDLRDSFEKDSQQLYDYLSAKIASSYDGSWVHEKKADYQTYFKGNWNQKELVTFFIYRFDKNILRRENLICSLEVQGQGNLWEKSPLIAPFIENFSKTNPGIMEKIKRADLSNLPSDRQTYIASKTYPFQQDPESIDAAFSEAVADFAFLVDPVDRAIESFKP